MARDSRKKRGKLQRVSKSPGKISHNEKCMGKSSKRKHHDKKERKRKRKTKSLVIVAENTKLQGDRKYILYSNSLFPLSNGVNISLNIELIKDEANFQGLRQKAESQNVLQAEDYFTKL